VGTIEAGKYENSSYEKQRTRIVSSLIPDDGKGKTALDIGCGSGWFTRILSQRGWNPHAIDLDQQNIKQAQKFAANVFQGDAVGILKGLPGGSYDFALALEIIEHVDKKKAKELLQDIHRVLKPRGALLISTPNRFSPEGWIGRLCSILSGIRGKWNAWDSSHVHVYSSMELIRLLKETGFRIGRVTGFWFGARISSKLHFPSLLIRSSFFPMNRMGFNTIVLCLKND
jgi:2-polyprenyl-3-methyl-5-hydroxy-6-metoxy-1,4-benzoquinol methylase